VRDAAGWKPAPRLAPEDGGEEREGAGGVDGDVAVPDFAVAVGVIGVKRDHRVDVVAMHARAVADGADDAVFVVLPAGLVPLVLALLPILDVLAGRLAVLAVDIEPVLYT